MLIRCGVELPKTLDLEPGSVWTFNPRSVGWFDEAREHQLTTMKRDNLIGKSLWIDWRRVANNEIIYAHVFCHLKMMEQWRAAEWKMINAVAINYLRINKSLRLIMFALTLLNSHEGDEMRWDFIPFNFQSIIIHLRMRFRIQMFSHSSRVKTANPLLFIHFLFR